MIKYKGYKKKYQLAGDLVDSNILPTHTVKANKNKVNHNDPTKSDYIPNFQVANDNWKSQQSVNTSDVYTNPQVKNDNIQQFKPTPQPTVKPVNTQGTITQGDSKVFEDNLYNNLRDNKTFNNLSDRLIIPTVNLMGGLELGALAKPLLKQALLKLQGDKILNTGVSRNFAKKQLSDFTKRAKDAQKAPQVEYINMRTKRLKQQNISEEVREKLNKALDNHYEVHSNSKAHTLGTNLGDRTIVYSNSGLSDINRGRISAHEVGHYYENSPKEATEWLKHFNLPQGSQGRYLRGKPMYDGNNLGNITSKGNLVSKGHANELRERAAQLKDYIQIKNNFKDNFIVTKKQFDDAVNNYVKDTQLDNSMTAFIKSINNKKGLIKTMNKYPLSIIPPLGAATYNSSQNKQYMSGGIIGTETFNVGNPGNREVKGSLSNKGKVIKGKNSNKITVASGQLRQYAQSVRAKYGMTLDDYVDKAKEENPNIKLTMTPGQWLINPTENNEVINNDKKFNLMVQSSNVNVDLKGLHEAQKTFDGIRNGFKETIGQTESNNNYNARNEITNATGKYQFIPRYHKETVENMFGIDWNTFASSPEYQERYMDYWTNKTLIPEAIKLQKKYPDSNLNMSQLMALVHFKGPEGARKELENPHLRETPQEFINGKSINISGNQYINKFKNVQPINNSLNELKRQSGGITKFQVAGDTKKKDITEIFKPENGTILPVQNNIPQVLLPEQEIKAKEPYWKEKQRQLEEGYLPYKGNKFLEKFIPKRYKSSKNQYEERKQDYIDEEMARTVLKENPYDRNTNANKYMYNLSQAERDILLKSQTWDKTARTYPDKLAQGLFSTFRGFTPNVASNKLGISPYDFNVNTYTRNEGKETGIGTALEGGFGYLAKPLQGVTNAVGITNFNKADNSNYTVKDALQGKQNDAGIIADALTDVTNYTGYGLGKKLIPNLTKRGKNVLNFLKESNYIQALNPNYYKRHVKDAATLMDEETLLKETGQNILNSKQTAIGNLKKINIKGDELYLQEGDIYKNLRSTPQYQKIEDLLYKTFYPPKNFPHPKNRLSPIAQQTINKKNSFQNINFSVDAKGRLVNTVSPSSFSNTGSIVTTPIEGGKNIINLRTGKQVPVTINPPKAEGVEEYIYDINSVAKKSNVPLKKTLSRQINSGDNYDINSEYIETLKDNISFIKEKFPNSKPYGSAVTVSEVGLPHLTNDVDVIMTKADYEKIKNSYPISHDIKYGAAHIVDESLGDVGKIDVNVLQEDKNGLATGNLAAEIYRQFFPDEFYAQNEKLIQKAINENKRLADVEIKILKTPDELLKSFDPETKSVIDAYEAGMEFGKEKHINRIDVLINYGDTDKVAKGQLQYAKSIMGSNADIGKQFDTSVFLDTNKNKEILNRIEFIGDKDKIAKDPKRMQLALNDYYINNSIYTRQVTLNPDYHKNIDNVIDSYMTWKGVGGTGSGAGLNTVKLGDSGLVHGQITGSKQFKLYNDEVKSLDDYVSLIERQTQGNYKFNSEEQDMIRDIAKKHNVSLNNIDFSKDLLFNWDQNGVTKYQSFLKNVGEQLKLKTIQEGYYGNSKYATDLGHFDSRVDKLKLSLQSYFPRLKSFEQRKQHFSNSNLGLDKKSVDLLKNEYHQLVNVLSTDYLKLMDERKINKTIVDNLNKRKQELLSKLKVDIEDKALNSLRENKKIVSSERDKLQKELSDIELEIYENDLDLDRLNWKIEELEDRKREISNIRKTYAGILVGGVALNEGRKQLNLDSTNYDADYNDDKKFIEGQLNQMNKWSPKNKERFNVNYDVWNKDSLEKSLQIKHSSDLWNLKDDNLNYVQKRKLKEAKHSIDKLMYRLTPDNYEKSLKNKEKRYFKTNTKPIETKVGHQFGGQIKYKQYVTK